MADTDLTELRKQCIQSLYLCADNISKYLDDEKEVEFEKLKSHVETYCLLEAQQDVAIQALDKAKSETDQSNIDSLKERFQKYLQSMSNKRLKVNNHPYMLEMNKRIQKGLDTARNNIDDSDLAITEAQEQYMDPITKRPIVDPVKNTVCGHIYEKETIMNMLNVKTKTKCPVVGCGNVGPILAKHLVSDEELRFRMTLTQHSTMIQERSVMDLDASI